MRRALAAAAAAIVTVLAACAPLPAPPPGTGGGAGGAAGGGPGAVAAGAPLAPEVAARNFVAVIDRVEPVAERICRDRAAPGTDCALRIAVDTTPGAAPNAFQTVDRRGRPVIGFTLALLSDARNQDELAFVMGHEAAHHILGHLDRTEQAAVTGALAAGILASLGGAPPEAVSEAQRIGAGVGARTFSKDFELEADSLGTVIAYRAGYDPLLGAAFFDRLPDPGDRFLGTHPPNAERRRVVAETLAAIR